MRSRFIKIIGCFMIVALSASIVPAALDGFNAPKDSKRLSDYDIPGFDNKINLNALKPWDVVQLIDFLALKGGLKNIVIAQGVSGLTTKLKFDNVTIGEALEIVLAVNGLAFEIKDGIITIMTDAEYIQHYGTSFYDKTEVRVLQLKYADPPRVSTMLEKVKSSVGTVVADPVTGTIILIDTPEKIREMESIIENADIKTISRVLPTVTETFVLQYADVDDIQNEITSVLTKEAGSMQTDRRTKTLIVTDLPFNMEKIKHLVASFDVKPKQVFIEAKIIEVTLRDIDSLGINWNHIFNGLDPRFSVASSSTPGGPSSPVGTLTYNTVTAGGNLEVILTALEQIGDTKILSNPHIAVRDGQEAKIQVIEEQPYKETTIESGTTNITGVTYIFKDVGVTLGVTPRINDDKFITVDVKPEISSISEWYDGAPQEGTPVIKKAYAETSVTVKDGVTIIIGGMIKKRKDKSRSAVPLLGRIPLLGMLFRYDNETTVNSETVVFMTPRIISGEKPYQRMEYMQKKPKAMRSVGGVETKKMKSIR